MLKQLGKGITRNALLAMATATVWATGVADGRSADRAIAAATDATGRGEEPRVASEARPRVDPGRVPGRKVALKLGVPVLVAEESLSLELLKVDERWCPRDKRCIWAGYATATLRVAKEGVEPAVVEISTPTPPALNRPRAAEYAGYRLFLESLPPGHSRNSPEAPASPTATVTATRLDQVRNDERN